MNEALKENFEPVQGTSLKTPKHPGVKRIAECQKAQPV